MPSKYDTNPLDPDFPEKVKTEAQQSAATQFLPVDETRQFAPEAEDATRRFSPDMTSAYSMPANPTFPVQPFYQNVSVGNIDESKERKVAKLGLPENVLVAAPYIPWFFGFVAGLALLLLTPKSESKAAETIFTIVTSVMLVIFAYKAFRGKPIHIAIIEDLTNYLDEKIGPIKT
jgi:hypothetical protein